MSWFENLPGDERPPEYLWEDEEGLAAWWEKIEAKRKDDIPHAQPGNDQDPTDQSPQVTENDHARFLKQAMA